MAENEKTVSSEQAVLAIRRQTRRNFSADEKIRIVLDGQRGDGVQRICAAARHLPRSIRLIKGGVFA
jgi:transposase-like protein